MSLQLGADDWTREIGYCLGRNSSLADEELLLELPDHVPGSWDPGGGRRTSSEEPHQVCRAQREAPGKVISADLRQLRLNPHAGTNGVEDLAGASSVARREG